MKTKVMMLRKSRTTNLLQLFLLLSIVILPASIQAQNLQLLEQELDSLIEATMESEHIPGAAFIIVKDDTIILKKGYGYTSLGEEIRRVDPDSTIFRIGSVTKTFTTTAALQLVDQGKIDLHNDVNNYLTSLQVSPTFKKAVTTAHLLNHSAGFDELRGRVVYQAGQRIPLGTFLNDRLVRLREPGIISSYSSYGIALAGLLVEDVSKMPLDQYMKENIWQPLGMTMTSMHLNDQVEQYASWGYEYRNGINVPQPWEFYHTYPASEINSTVADMGKYMLMHLHGGTYKGQTILSKEMSAAMKTPQLAIDPEIESFCYGLYEEYAEGLRTVSHGGDMLGYSGYMALVPEKSLGIYVVHHHEGTRLRYQVLGTILRHFNAEAEQAEKPRKISGDLSKFAGNYRWSTYCHTCTNGWMPDLESLTINTDQSISIFNRKYIQVAPLLFKTEDGLRTMGFVENKDGEIIYMSTGGNNVFEKI